MTALAAGWGEYTVAALVAVAAVLVVDLWVLRTRVLRRPRCWLALAIVLGFQIPVDGWLTRPDATVVHYDEEQIIGLRVFGTFPVEDIGFGFALATLTLSVWHRLRPPALRKGPLLSPRQLVSLRRRGVRRWARWRPPRSRTPPLR